MENNVVRKSLPLKLIEINEGQIPGLARNPRQWTYADIERLKISIQETPALLDARGVIVYPHSGKYVAIGGNLRVTALRAMGQEEVPCILLPENTPIEELRAIAIKDNGSFGEWDEKLLLEDWNEEPLADWGCLTLNTDEPEEERKDTKKAEEKEIFEVMFTATEYEFVADKLRDIDEIPEQALLILINGEINNGE